MRPFPKSWFKPANIQQDAKHDMARVLDAMFHPASLIDTGCGPGHWLEWWVRYRPGVKIFGVDNAAETCRQLAIPELWNRISRSDLTTWAAAREHGDWPFRPGQRAHDLVLCVEVAAHLEELHAEPLVAGLCQLGDRVFFSSASNMKGKRIVHQRPKSYWEGLFGICGFVRRMQAEDRWYGRLKYTKGPGQNIRKNAMILERADQS